MKANKGKTYFALSKDQLGVIDLFEIEMEWREKKEKEEGRSRMHVYKDYFWREPFVADLLERLTGTLDDSGTVIKHMVQYPKGNHLFKIKSFYPSPQLRNRQVTFVLAFTWSGLRAFDVVEKCEESSSNGGGDNVDTHEESEPTVHVKPREIDYSLYQRKSSPTNDMSSKSKQSHTHRDGLSTSERFEICDSGTRHDDAYRKRRSPGPLDTNAESILTKYSGDFRNQKQSKEYQSKTEMYPPNISVEPSRYFGDTVRFGVQDSHNKLSWNKNRKDERYIKDAKPWVTTQHCEQSFDNTSEALPSGIQGLVVTSDRKSSSNEPDIFFENAGHGKIKSSISKQHMDYATVASLGTSQQFHPWSERQFPDYSVQGNIVRPKDTSKRQHGLVQEKSDAALQDLSQNTEYWEHLQKEVMDFGSVSETASASVDTLDEITMHTPPHSNVEGGTKAHTIRDTEVQYTVPEHSDWVTASQKKKRKKKNKSQTVDKHEETTKHYLDELD